MKTALVLLFVCCSVQGRKLHPIDKNANVAFINMEGGGGARPPSQPSTTPPPKTTPVLLLTPSFKPPVVTVPTPTQPNVPTPYPVKPIPKQSKPIPVNPAPVVKPITTPGPGSVKQLVNFYDSQGKASLIRPYSYSQAVKQG